MVFLKLPSSFWGTENIQALRKNFQLEQFPRTKKETKAQSILKPPKNFGKPFQTLFGVLFAQFGVTECSRINTVFILEHLSRGFSR